MHLEDKDADQQKERDGAGSDPPVSPSAFELFEEFARKVISVPRATIEERERIYRENRDKPKPGKA